MLLSSFFSYVATSEYICHFLISCTVFPVQRDPRDVMFSWLDHTAVVHKALPNAFEQKQTCKT